MYQAEAKGLQRLAATQTIAVPEVVLVDEHEGDAYLVMYYVKSKRPAPYDFEQLGRQLAKLHQTATNAAFGNDHDNYIGSLPQSNSSKADWPTFYVKERLLPQYKLAGHKGLLSAQQLPSEESLVPVCTSLFGKVKPALLHGDLWGGNFLIATDGSPYLIDPAVYYGHSEVDLAMSKLFGGFGGQFYSAYHEIIPPHDNQSALTEIYQLYYLLVHLNLFGRSYLGSVLQITERYFK